MPKQKSAPDAKPIEQYTHADKKRHNNPQVGLVTPDTDRDGGKQVYSYDPHLDPQLNWAGKAEHTSFEIPIVSLHVHERIDPRAIIENVRRKHETEANYQPSLFFGVESNLPLFQEIEFYKHKHNWANRLVAGDSLLVMNSLLVKEGMAGQVQMIYFDPPYGIKYGSNFQPFVNKRDVKDGKDDDLTSEPETLKAFRDTWELGIHSYLTYLRDRLLLARELLHETGSIFVQISDENVHLVRNLMDEVFGRDNFVSTVIFAKTSGLEAANRVASTFDYLIWYCKDSKLIKYRQLWSDKTSLINSRYTHVELPNSERRRMTQDEFFGRTPLPEKSRIFTLADLTKPGPGSRFEFEFEGRTFTSGARWWGTTPESMQRLAKAKRFVIEGNTLRFVRYLDDFPFQPIHNSWTDVGGSVQSRTDPKIYVVQTGTAPIERCLLMTTDPSDLVLDITCGSGTTAFVAEQWGRRWITCDTSRVALALAKQRLMTATFDFFGLAKPEEGVASGFKYKTVPHVTLKSIANNEPPAQETLYDQPLIE